MSLLSSYMSFASRDPTSRKETPAVSLDSHTTSRLHAYEKTMTRTSKPSVCRALFFLSGFCLPKEKPLQSKCRIRDRPDRRRDRISSWSSQENDLHQLPSAVYLTLKNPNVRLSVKESIGFQILALLHIKSMYTTLQKSVCYHQLAYWYVLPYVPA